MHARLNKTCFQLNSRSIRYKVSNQCAILTGDNDFKFFSLLKLSLKRLACFIFLVKEKYYFYTRCFYNVFRGKQWKCWCMEKSAHSKIHFTSCTIKTVIFYHTYQFRLKISSVKVFLCGSITLSG